MSHPTHHIFFSYSRADDDPLGNGWVKAFYKRLQASHRAHTGRELRVFYDQKKIEDGSDWRFRLGQELRRSRLFLAFLSPNYIRSRNCRWEWQEFLRREHTQARGDDGVATVYFQVVPGMPQAGESRELELLEAELRADPAIAAWLDEVIREMRRRHLYVDPAGSNLLNPFHPQAAFDLRQWFPHGPAILQELDAAERLAELRANPQADTQRVLTLAERLAEIDRRISKRLDRCLLAELAPGIASLGRSYPHFVGRHRELRDLHRALIAERRGIVTAVHGLGGQGKTALAIQYAHAYAEFYAAGGRWVIPAEGVKTMPEALLQLASAPELGIEIPEVIRAHPIRAAEHVLWQLEQFAHSNALRLRERLRTAPERMSDDERLPEIEPRALVILDNVDQPSLLAADQIAMLPQAEWFELVVTTRLDAQRFGIGKDVICIAVDALPIDDALALLREFQPEQRFTNEDDERAARHLCELLGGFTLSVELVGAYLGAHLEISPAAYCEALVRDGLPAADSLSDHAVVVNQVRHREKQLAVVLDWTLSRLDAASLRVLQYAAMLAPDFVVTEWLREACGFTAPPDAARPDPWLGVWRQLEGLRLLTPAENEQPVEEARGRRGPQVPRLARIHRLVAAHLAAMLTEEDANAIVETLCKPLSHDAHGFQERWRDEPATHSLLRPLEENALHLLSKRRDSRQLALACGIAGAAELGLGRLSRAEPLLVAGGSSLNSRRTAMPGTQAEFDYAVWLIDMSELHLLCGHEGASERAIDTLEESLAILQELLRLDPDSMSVMQGLHLVQDRLADCCYRRGRPGDLERALALREESVKAGRRAAAEQPESNWAVRNLAVAINKLGDLFASFEQPENVERAKRCFREALSIQRSISSGGASPTVMNDLALTLQRLALLDLQSGNPDELERGWKGLYGSLQLLRLVDDHGRTLTSAMNVATILTRLASSHLNRGQEKDLEIARTHLENALEIHRDIEAAKWSNSQSLHNLAFCLNALAEVHLRRGEAGDNDRALEYFEHALRIRRGLHHNNPSSAEAASELSVSLGALATFLFRNRTPIEIERVEALFEEALQLRRKIREANPDLWPAARGFAASLFELSQAKLARGSQEAAIPLLRECFDTLRAFAARGQYFDEQVRQLYEWLLQRFTSDTSSDTS